MNEHLWTLTRREEDAVAVLDDLGVNGFALTVSVGSATPTIDRFVTRELAIDHAAAERRRLEKIGWQ